MGETIVILAWNKTDVCSNVLSPANHPECDELHDHGHLPACLHGNQR